MVLKITQYLRSAREDGAFWRDKWHISTAYATSQVVQALAGLDNELVRTAVTWMLSQQRDDGAWGFGDGTAEETAWALYGLMEASAKDASLRPLCQAAIDRGGTFLNDHRDDPCPELWISKCLYAPYNMVRAIILGVLQRWRQDYLEARPGGFPGGL
jgi:halimadienyl-diphosphate synthase